jgi:succinoglycan biosynthesis transport protein ExoP
LTPGQSILPIASLAPLSDEAPPAKPIDLAWIAGVPLRRWKLVLAAPVLTLLAVAGILKLMPPVYQASVQILMFDPRQQDLNPGTQQAASIRAFDIIGTNTEIGIIKSQAMMEDVVKDLRLDQNPEFQPARSVEEHWDWLSSPTLSGLMTRVHGFLGEEAGPAGVAAHVPDAGDAAQSQERRIAIAADMLREHYVIERLPLSYIMTISARSHDPRLSKQLAETLVRDYFADQKKDRQKGLIQMEAWLAAKLAELKARSTETGVAIEKLKAESGVDGSAKDSLVDRQISELNTQLTTAHSAVADKQARLEQIDQQAEGAGIDLSVPETASPVIAQLRMQQTVLTQQEAELRSKFGSGHASVIAVAAQLANIRRAINDEAGRVRSDLQASYDLAVRRDQALRVEIQKLTTGRDSSGDYEKLQELRQLRQAADANSKVYDAYLARYSEIESSKSVIDTNERIISSASVPTEPVSPRHKLFYLIGGGMGVAFGLLLALVIDITTGGIKMGAEAEQAFGFPVVGNVPMYRFGKKLQRSRARTLALSIVNEPLSPLSEAIRTIRVCLRLSNQMENPKVIVVTSSVAGEGKSTLSLLLAASSAAAGHRTILVDCDIRGRSISRDLGVQQLGLTDVLAGNANLLSVIVRHPETDCFVLPAGSVVHSPGDLLASSRMSATIARLRDGYDYIVIDTPPLLSVVDGLAIAGIADKIIVAIDGRKTRPASVAEAFRLLRPEARRIAGIVFNKAEPEQLRRYGIQAYAGDYPYFDAHRRAKRGEAVRVVS